VDARTVSTLDVAFLQGVEARLQEWNSAFDKEAFADPLPEGDAITTDQNRKNDEQPLIQH